MRTPQYDRILQNMAGSDERAVYAVLCQHVGADNRITREQLGRQVARSAILEFAKTSHRAEELGLINDP